MIYIVDRFVEKQSHALANVNLIKIIDLIYKSKSMVFISEQSHNSIVASYFTESSSRIDFEGFKAIGLSDNKFKRFFKVFIRLVKDLAFFVRLLAISNRDEDKTIFLAHIYPFSLVFLKILKFFYPRVNLIIIIHGEVEYIFHSNGNYEKYIALMYKWAFKIKTKHCYYLFLTKISRKILIDNGNLGDSEIITCMLPLMGGNIDTAIASKELTSPIVIGHIGSAGLRKNVNILYDIAKSYKHEIKQLKVLFTTIGQIESNLSPYLNEFVEDYVNSTPNVHMDRNLFNDMVEKINYSIFFYGMNDFVLRLSGAFFDAIFFERPMIVLSNQFFKDVFNECGSLGYLCENLEEMRTTINKIIDNSEEVKSDYNKFKQNIINYKNTLDLSKVSDEVAQQLIKLNVISTY